MLRPYLEVLRTPGARGFVLAAAVGRLPMSMLALGVVFLVEEATGSYGTAGAVTAVTGGTQALCGPLIGRLVDRLGQRAALVPAVLVHVTGVLSLVAVAESTAPDWVLFPVGALTGASMPLFTSMVRARWSHLLGASPGGLQSAFALESVVDEVVYIVGPVLIAVLATTVSPAAALSVTVVFTASGGLALAAQRGTEPPRRMDTGERHPSAVRLPALRVVVGSFVALGVVFGTVEVALVAFADARDVPVAAGLLVAVLSVASMAAGLAYGAVQWGRPVDLRLRLSVAGLAGSSVLLALAPGIATMALACVAAGVTFAPTMISGFALVQARVGAGTLTEALAWLTSSVNVGAAGGAAAAGWVAEEVGAREAFLVGVGGAVACAAVAWAGARWLRAPAGEG